MHELAVRVCSKIAIKLQGQMQIIKICEKLETQPRLLGSCKPSPAAYLFARFNLSLRAHILSITKNCIFVMINPRLFKK